jgi:hypothetical protein
LIRRGKPSSKTGVTVGALLIKESRPTESVELTYEARIVEGRAALPTVLNIFGVVIVTDPLMRDWDPDDIEYSEPFNVWRF